MPALIEALDRPEAQTRWEALDALTALATTCPEQLGDAFEGAEMCIRDSSYSALCHRKVRDFGMRYQAIVIRVFGNPRD